MTRSSFSLQVPFTGSYMDMFCQTAGSLVLSISLISPNDDSSAFTRRKQQMWELIPQGARGAGLQQLECCEAGTETLETTLIFTGKLVGWKERRREMVLVSSVATRVLWHFSWIGGLGNFFSVAYSCVAVREPPNREHWMHWNLSYSFSFLPSDTWTR